MKVIDNEKQMIQDVSSGTIVYSPLSNFYYLVTDEHECDYITCVNVHTGQIVRVQLDSKVVVYKNSFITIE